MNRRQIAVGLTAAALMAAIAIVVFISPCALRRDCRPPVPPDPPAHTQPAEMRPVGSVLI